LSAAPFGIAHDIAVSAWPALTGAILSLAIASFALNRELRARRPRRGLSGLSRLCKFA
jgi:hypothetical protein